MLTVHPIELYDANSFIDRLHRHHWAMKTHRFSLGAYRGARLVGVCVCQRPTNQAVDSLRVIEVARLCTDGAQNACSILYGAAGRVAKELGYEKIQTFTLESEPGVTLRAVGWLNEGVETATPWNTKRKTDSAIRLDLNSDEDKQRWARYLDPWLEAQARPLLDDRAALNKLVRAVPKYITKTAPGAIPCGMEFMEDVCPTA